MQYEARLVFSDKLIIFPHRHTAFPKSLTKFLLEKNGGL
jgi:hypothetical protein